MTRMSNPAIPADLIAALTGARAVVALTGAGVSAESGIPTFRDAQSGEWARYDPMEIATPEAFARNPELVTRWYDERRRRCAACRPNPGHDALARLEAHLDRHGRRLTLVTQNVDGLHQRAGSRNVVELHGSLWLWWCTSCGAEAREEQVPFATHPPRCDACGGMRRPGVVWFGEMLSATVIGAAEQATGSCDLFLALGTSAVVHPAAGLVHLARAHGATTVEINPEPTPISTSVDFRIAGQTGQMLPALVDAIVL